MDFKNYIAEVLHPFLNRNEKNKEHFDFLLILSSKI